MMGLAVKSAVLFLVGSPSEREQEKMDVDATITQADGIVYDITRKDDWVPDDYGYDLAVNAANKWAASELLLKFNDPKNRAPVFQKDFEDSVDKLRKTGFGGSKDSGNPLFSMEIGSYKENAEAIGPFLSKGFFGADIYRDYWSEFNEY
jgi:hypothetical protein